MRKRYLTPVLALITVALWADGGMAAAPALKLAPLLFQQTFSDVAPKIGYIDISNPTDATLSINANVQGFRQIDLSGDLEYYDDKILADAITISTPTFDLGPREAYHVAFTVDPSKLPKGAVYAAMFFQTRPPAQAPKISYIAESAKVGSLLIISNGHGVEAGTIHPHFGFLQLGDGLSGSVRYSNTGQPPTAVPFNPRLSVTALPFGHPTRTVTMPMVFPGNSRDASLSKPGNYLGVFPISIYDDVTGQHRDTWVLAITGFWRWVAGIGLPVLLLLGLLNRRRRLRKPKRLTTIHQPPGLKVVPTEPEAPKPAELDADAPEPAVAEDNSTTEKPIEVQSIPIQVVESSQETMSEPKPKSKSESTKKTIQNPKQIIPIQHDDLDA